MAAVIRKCCLPHTNLLSNLQTYSRVNARRWYAKKLVSKVGVQASQRARMEVETDPEKLIKYCCGANIFVEGLDPELKPDSEYPEWLWKLNTERGGPSLSDLNPDSLAYWRKLGRMTELRDRNVRKRLQKLKDIEFPDDKE